MMTRDEYIIRLVIANETKKWAQTSGKPIMEELADLAITALTEQWERSEAARIIAESIKDTARLDWMIANSVQVWQHPDECFYTCCKDGNDYCHYGNTAREAIDEAMAASC